MSLAAVAAAILALFGILNSKGIPGIRSWVAGHVLGGLNSAKAAARTPSRPASPPTDAETGAQIPGAPGTT